MAVLSIVGKPLINDTAPLGMISFEIACSPGAAEEIVKSWDDYARENTLLSLKLDFVYLVSYALTLGCGCAWTAGGVRAQGFSRTALIGVLLATGQCIAGLLDAVEDIALIIIMHGTIATPWPQIACLCAVPKFLLIIAGVFYCLIGIAVHTPAQGAGTHHE